MRHVEEFQAAIGAGPQVRQLHAEPALEHLILVGIGCLDLGQELIQHPMLVGVLDQRQHPGAFALPNGKLLVDCVVVIEAESSQLFVRKSRGHEFPDGGEVVTHGGSVSSMKQEA